MTIQFTLFCQSWCAKLMWGKYLILNSFLFTPAYVWDHIWSSLNPLSICGIPHNHNESVSYYLCHILVVYQCGQLPGYIYPNPENATIFNLVLLFCSYLFVTRCILRNLMTLGQVFMPTYANEQTLLGLVRHTYGKAYVTYIIYMFSVSVLAFWS